MSRAVVLGLVSVLLASCWSSPRPQAAAEVSVTVRYGVGAAEDPAGREGLAHLVEHLMFEHVRGDTTLFDIFEDRALEFSGFTTNDETLYSSRALPSQLEELLELETVRLAQPCT